MAFARRLERHNLYPPRSVADDIMGMEESTMNQRTLEGLILRKVIILAVIIWVLLFGLVSKAVFMALLGIVSVGSYCAHVEEHRPYRVFDHIYAAGWWVFALTVGNEAIRGDMAPYWAGFVAFALAWITSHKWYRLKAAPRKPGKTVTIR